MTPRVDETDAVPLPMLRDFYYEIVDGVPVIDLVCISPRYPAPRRDLLL